MENEKIMESLEYLTGELEICSGIIERATGIELTWAEKVALKMYIDKFTEQNLNDSAIHYFMSDYFGMDWVSMGSTDVKIGIGNEDSDWIKWGMDFLGTSEFKEYCRNHVQQWREESELGIN